MIVLFWIFIFAIGLNIGSFLNVVIHRGPALWGLIDDETADRGNLALPRSYCPNCRTQIAVQYLIPVIGYFLTKGKCAHCSNPISVRYLFVELTGGAIAIIALAAFGLSVEAVLCAIFGWTLLALGVIDFETGYLPDALTLPLGALGIAISFAGLFTPFLPSLIGAIAGYALFWAIGAVYRRWRGINALGLGDAKLLAALGAWLGWQALPLIIFIGSLTTLFFVGINMVCGKTVDAKAALPFGPGLCLAGFITLSGKALFASNGLM